MHHQVRKLGNMLAETLPDADNMRLDAKNVLLALRSVLRVTPSSSACRWWLRRQWRRLV